MTTLNFLTLPAPAKLNLFLHITGRRADGYHTLQTVFQILDFGDTLRFELTDKKEVSFQCSNPALESADNLVMQAARLLTEETGIIFGTNIMLEKRLPMGGGVGGGSSDAATTLLALNQLWGCALNTETLALLGLRLGADVPLFIRGRSAWAENIGESLHPIELPEHWFLVITPACEVSTKKIFCHPQLTRNTYPIKIAAFPFPGSKNDCEKLVSSLYPAVQKTLDRLSHYAAARMTGTGASIFASFNTEQEAQQVMKQVSKELASEQETEKFSAFIAKGVNISPLQLAMTD